MSAPSPDVATHVAVAEAVRLAVRGEREACAKICEAMVIGGRAWTHEQSVAADALHAAARNIRERGAP